MLRSRHIQRITVVALPLLLLALLYAAFERRSWLPRVLVKARGETIVNLAFSPDGSTLVCAKPRQLYAIDTASGEILRTTKHLKGQPTSVWYSNDGKFLLTGESSGAAVKLWNASSFQLQQQLVSFGDTEAHFEAKFSPDNRYILGAGNVGWEEDLHIEVKLWDATTRKCLWSVNDENPNIKSFVKASAFSPSLKEIVYVMNDRILRRRDVVTGELIISRELKVNSSRYHGNQYLDHFFFSPGGKLLAGCDDQGGIQLWDTTGTPLHRLHDHTTGTQTIAFSRDEGLLAGGSIYQKVHLWDVKTGAMLRTMDGYRQPVITVAFSDDGRTLATGSSDGRVVLWRIK